MVMYSRDLLDLCRRAGSMGGGRGARTVVAWRLARPLEAFAGDMQAATAGGGAGGGGGGGTLLTLEFVSPAVAAHVIDLLSR